MKLYEIKIINILQGLSQKDLVNMKEIYGSLDNIVQSQIHQVQDLHSLEGQIISIVSHPWHRLVSLYRTHYEQFNFNHYQLYGYEMAHNGLIGKGKVNYCPL